MQATISSFRRGRHTQTDNQMVLKVDSVDSKEKAEKLVGKAVVFTTTSGKHIAGKISAAHGNSGAVRAIFERGMPGQSLGCTVAIK